MRKMYILIVVGVFALLSLGYAQDDVRRQLAEELLMVLSVDKNIEQSLAMIKQMQMDRIKDFKPSKELPSEVSEEIAPMLRNMVDMAHEEYRWDKLKEDFIDIYADMFTKEELEGLIAFYKTPVGQKYIKKQPELMQKSMEIIQKKVAKIQNEIKKEFAKILKKIEDKKK